MSTFQRAGFSKRWQLLFTEWKRHSRSGFGFPNIKWILSLDLSIVSTFWMKTYLAHTRT